MHLRYADEGSAKTAKASSATQESCLFNRALLLFYITSGLHFYLFMLIVVAALAQIRKSLPMHPYPNNACCCKVIKNLASISIPTQTFIHPMHLFAEKMQQIPVLHIEMMELLYARSTWSVFCAWTHSHPHSWCPF